MQEECTIRDSRPLITTVQLQTDLYLDTEQVLPFFIRILSSTIQQVHLSVTDPWCLVTEKVRSVGAQLVNANGEAYIHPLETRDVNASGVIRECEEGRGVEVPGGLKGVWLDTPMIEILGRGNYRKENPGNVPYVHELRH